MEEMDKRDKRDRSLKTMEVQRGGKLGEFVGKRTKKKRREDATPSPSPEPLNGRAVPIGPWCKVFPLSDGTFAWGRWRESALGERAVVQH